MKTPNWFIVGCGLLVLNIVAVLGGTIARHASASSPDDDTKQATVDTNLPVPAENHASSTADAPKSELLPQVPSLENAAESSSILKLDDFKAVFNSTTPPNDLLAPLDEMLKESPTAVPEQLSHSFFDSLTLRLETTEHLNQSALGLVEEASIVFQRGDIKKAQELLRTATTIREMTAKLLVTHE